MVIFFLTDNFSHCYDYNKQSFIIKYLKTSILIDGRNVTMKTIQTGITHTCSKVLLGPIEQCLLTVEVIWRFAKCIMKHPRHTICKWGNRYIKYKSTSFLWLSQLSAHNLNHIKQNRWQLTVNPMLQPSNKECYLSCGLSTISGVICGYTKHLNVNALLRLQINKNCLTQ